MTFTSKEQLVSTLKDQIKSRPHVAIKALVTIFQQQTSQEQNHNTTEEDNGVGFTGTDAKFLSSLAKQFISFGHLSNKQTCMVSKIMPKYARQLIDLSLSSGKIKKENGKYIW